MRSQIAFRTFGCTALLLVAATVSAYADSFAYASYPELTANFQADNSYFGVLDLNTGRFTQIAEYKSFFADDLARSSNGTLYLAASHALGGVNATELDTLDPLTGAITHTTALSAPSVGFFFGGVTNLAFAPSGVLYGLAAYLPKNSNQEIFQLVSIDPASGLITFVANLGTPLNGGRLLNVGGLRFVGNTAYTVGIERSSIFRNSALLYSVNLTSGNATLVGNTGLSYFSPEVAIDGALVGVANAGSTPQLYTVDPANASGTAGPPLKPYYNFVSGASAPVPEPGNLTLLGPAAAIAMFLLRGRPLSSRARPPA